MRIAAASWILLGGYAEQMGELDIKYSFNPTLSASFFFFFLLR